MSQTSPRAFRFPRSVSFAAHQFQPFENTRFFPKGSAFGLNEENRKKYDDYVEYWKSLEQTSLEFHEEARSVTQALQSQFADRIETMAPLYLKLPHFSKPYAFTGSAKEQEIGYFPVPEDQENCGKLLAAILGNVARRLTLATNRSLFALGNPRLLLVFVDSQIEYTEAKTLIKLNISFDGRYAVAHLSTYTMCFQLNWYEDYMRKRRPRSEKKFDIVARTPNHGPFLELDECGRLWLSIDGGIGAPLKKMKTPPTSVAFSHDKVSASKNHAILVAVRRGLESIQKRLSTEVQAGVLEIVNVGPAPDDRGHVVL